MRPDRPEVGGANDLNDLARRRGWAVVCDAECRFTREGLDELHALWRSMARPIPRRSEMTARLLKPYLTDMVFHERVAGPDGTRRYRVRLMGGSIAQIAGEASGKFYDEFLPEKSVLIWNAMTDTVLGHGAPVRMLIRADELDKTYLVGELFAAPLLADDGAASIVLTVGQFGGNRRWEDVAVEFHSRNAAASAID